MGSRTDPIRFECPHCKDINRSLVVTLSCKRGSSTVVRTRRCLKCNEVFYTSEVPIEDHSDRKAEIKKGLRELETKIVILKNKLSYL